MHFGEESCDLETGFNGVVNHSNGHDHFALAMCNRPGDDCEYIDTYGIPGTLGLRKPQDFTNGRVFRVDLYRAPEKYFYINQWMVEHSVNAVQCDPNLLTPPPVIVTAPAPAPSTSNDRPSKSKSKRNLRFGE